METVYFNEYAMSQMLKELYQIEVGQTAFLQVKDKNILKDLKNKYPLYQFKLANSSLSSSIDEKFQQIEWILYCFSSLSVVTACFFIRCCFLYLMVIKRKKIFCYFTNIGGFITADDNSCFVSRSRYFLHSIYRSNDCFKRVIYFLLIS